MRVEKTAIAGLLIVMPDIFSDERGVFVETYQRKRYEEAGVPFEFIQDNLSVSRQGVLRGLHYQMPPFEQGKLVQVLVGRALDVAVDIRFGSPTFGQHVAVELTPEERRQFWIPPGFAHGFVALEPDTVFAYKCTKPYSKAHERGLRFDDPALGIAWRVAEPVVAERDQAFPLLRDLERHFIFTA